MSEFDFEVRHIKGKENKVVDALIRRVDGLLEINISRTENNLEQIIKDAGNNVENYTITVADLRNNTKNSEKTYISLDRNGLLRFKNRI